MNRTPRGGFAARAALLLLAAAAAAAAANFLSPRRIPWVEDWSNYIEAKALKEGLVLVNLDEAATMQAAGTHLLLDARSAADYEAGHLPGAFSVPYTTVEEDLMRVAAFLSPSQPILAYCYGENCDESFLLAAYLRHQGFTNIVLFAGGFQAWEQAGRPVERGPSP